MGRTGPRPHVLPVVLLIVALASIAALAAWAGWLLVGEPGGLNLRVLVPLMVLAYVGVLLRERSVGPHMGVSLSMVVLAGVQVRAKASHSARMTSRFDRMKSARRMQSSISVFVPPEIWHGPAGDATHAF